MQLKAFIIYLMATGAYAYTHGQLSRHQHAHAANNMTKPEFGGQTPSSGTGATYCGNHGNPYGSNILLIDKEWVSSFKYVAQFYSPPETTESWNIVVWNKCGQDGGLDGFFGEWVQNFQLAPNETKYVVFDEDSQGGWGAAPGTSPILNTWGSCASTWGEFDFANAANNASGYDVSSIVAQTAALTVQGMQICAAQSNECSSISNSGTVINAYTEANKDQNDIAPWLNGDGPVTLNVTINFSG
jgi:hypothetical protein